MTSSLGEKLRRARESKGLELREVADQTRIAYNYLEAIEADNYKPLPGGIFNKGFVRSFAKAVGVDEKEALADYTNMMAEQGGLTPNEDVDNLPRRPEVLTSDRQGSPFGKILIALIILGLAFVGIYYGVQYMQQQAAVAPQVAPSPAPDNAVNTQPSPTPPSVADGLKIQVKATSALVNLTPTVDGKPQNAVNLQPGETKDFNGQQSVKLQYAKSLAGTLEMTINGRPATVKAVSDNPRRVNSIEMEITRGNFAQYLK